MVFWDSSLLIRCLKSSLDGVAAVVVTLAVMLVVVKVEEEALLAGRKSGPPLEGGARYVFIESRFSFSVLPVFPLTFSVAVLFVFVT